MDHAGDCSLDCSPSYSLFVGIDISYQTFDVVVLSDPRQPKAPLKLPQSPKGYGELNKRLLSSGHAKEQTLIVMEATGSYWMRLAHQMHSFGYSVSVINPSQAHHFAQALLKRSKTDAMDAHTLAVLAHALKPDPWSPPPAVYDELEQRLADRDALLSMRQQELNRLHALEQRPRVIGVVRERMQELIGLCTRQIAVIDAELQEVMAQDEEWQKAAERLRSIKGLGPITVGYLLVSTLNFSLCENAEHLASFAGLAPRDRESGTSLKMRARIGHAGDGRLRQALYMATLSAAQSNPIIKRFYQRLRAAGKPVKVARCAAARKLLHIAWAVATKGTTFDPDYEQRKALATALD